MQQFLNQLLAYAESLPGSVNLGIIWGLMALGVFITYKVLDVADLTVDGSFAMGGIVCAVFLKNGGNFAVGLLLGFVAGVLCGLVTGLLHTFLGIPPILAGILTQLACWSINLKIASGAANISVNARTTLVLVSQLDKYNALWILFLTVAVIVAILYVFFGTQLGASIRATGNNQKMARAQGINTKFNIVLGLMISNGIVALAGALLTQYQGFADINMGRGAIVIGLCSVVIGHAIFSKISPNFGLRMAAVVVGGIIYYVIFSTVVFIGMDTDFLKMLAAVVVAIFLGVPYIKSHYYAEFKQRLANRKMKKKQDVEG